MSNLSDELRACAHGHFGVKTNKDYMLRAADEIDRLTKLIHDTANKLTQTHHRPKTNDEMLCDDGDPYYYVVDDTYTREELAQKLKEAIQK